MIKFAGDPDGLVSPVRKAILAVDPDQPISNVITMHRHVARMLVTEGFSAFLAAALALLGLLLAIIGPYGVISYSVSRQTGEIGLRIALGAARGDILKMDLG